MRFEELLEKKEAKQIGLLKNLVMTGGKQPIQEMAQRLQVTKKSVETYVEDLQLFLKRYKEQCRLVYDGYYLALSLAPEFSVSEIENQFYQEAPKFQILVTLLQEREIAFVRVSQELQISESSLSRKIKELNLLLKEFDLTIWQGKMEGEEAQIRYFYFQLLWYMGNSVEEVSGRNQRYVENIERGLDIQLRPEARKRVLLWLKITKLRLNVPHQKFARLNKKFQPYLKDPMYQKLKQIVYRSFGYYAVEIQEEEAMLHFCFLLSMSILSEAEFHQYSLVRSRFTPTGLVDTLLLENILRFYRPIKVHHEVEALCYYYLAQIHPQLYFFKGDIEVYNRENIWAMEQELSSRDMRGLCQKLLALAQESFALPEDEQNSLLAMTAVKYLSVLAILDFQMNREVRVGIHLKMEPLFKNATITMLILHLKSLNGVVVEECRENQTYDLIISNEKLPTHKTVYYFSELGTKYDIAQIKQLIRNLSS
ncbi:transcriptional regulator [Enterococcus sp. JM4C]|uniref:helix-turn-helix domain-containing protein n=1 Tax=Candidatus Enterococcus huntleyi TaxID=1857217 RepID=UPI00137B1CD8|nr:helix-turn-helix domain-containing protein [Enterococcus sp. JM4C]KAF1297351.1 transcriptional regulator [Enterococcus sp. JM4C]